LCVRVCFYKRTGHVMQYSLTRVCHRDDLRYRYLRFPRSDIQWNSTVSWPLRTCIIVDTRCRVQTLKGRTFGRRHTAEGFHLTRRHGSYADITLRHDTWHYGFLKYYNNIMVLMIAVFTCCARVIPITGILGRGIRRLQNGGGWYCKLRAKNNVIFSGNYTTTLSIHDSVYQ